MKLCTGIFFFFFVTFGTTAAELTVDGVEFAYRLPAGQPQAIMVLFGGRNWKGADTLKRFRFDDLADRHRLILLSPSFRDRNYWEPEKWSGPGARCSSTAIPPVVNAPVSFTPGCRKKLRHGPPMPVASTRRKSLALMLRRSSPAESRIQIATGSVALSSTVTARPMENCSGNPFPAAMNSIQKLSNLPEPGSSSRTCQSLVRCAAFRSLRTRVR